VIASVTGTHTALVVTEPTLSGLHDMQRAVQLARHFGVRTFACINKFDLNRRMADEIELQCERDGVEVVARIPYDPVVTRAQIMAKSVVEYSDGAVSEEMKRLWRRMAAELK